MSYSETQHTTWRRYYQAFQDLYNRYRDHIHEDYTNHAPVLAAFANGVPSLAAINQLLEPTGFQAAYVSGYCPPWTLAQMLADGLLPVSSQLRPPQEVFFAREPDLIHDVFGHIPPLFSQRYRSQLRSWAATAARQPISQVDLASFHLNKLIAQQHSHENAESSWQPFRHLLTAGQEIATYSQCQPSTGHYYDKLYFWFFEYGLLGQANDYKVLGAGLLTSLTELPRIARGSVATAMLKHENLFTSHKISQEQERYLVTKDWQTLQRLIEAPQPDDSRASLRA